MFNALWARLRPPVPPAPAVVNLVTEEDVLVYLSEGRVRNRQTEAIPPIPESEPENSAINLMVLRHYGEELKEKYGIVGLQAIVDCRFGRIPESDLPFRLMFHSRLDTSVDAASCWLYLHDRADAATERHFVRLFLGESALDLLDSEPEHDTGKSEPWPERRELQPTPQAGPITPRRDWKPLIIPLAITFTVGLLVGSRRRR